MPHMAPPNYRQQRAIDAIDRATVELSIAIRTHAPDTDAVRQAQRMLMTRPVNGSQQRAASRLRPLGSLARETDDA